MTFAEVEALVGPLPASARLHRAWWANGTNIEARAWRAAGWRVQSVNQAAEEVEFARDAMTAAQRGTQPADSRMPYIDAEVAAAVVARADALGFHPAKLRRLIEELNDNYSRGNTYAAHALLRAILDHIPPLLGCREFHNLVSNHSWGRTDGSYVRKLQAFRLQANDALHRAISRKSDLLSLDDMPPRIWINRVLQECATES
jgi:hypothetical protein